MKDKLFLLPLYVDHLILINNDAGELHKIKQIFKNRFKITELGQLSYFLGMQIETSVSDGTLIISQEKYIKEILFKYGFHEFRPVKTPIDKITLKKEIQIY